MRKTTASIDLPLYLWIGLMIALSSIPGGSMPELLHWQWDKLTHFFEYLIFSLLLYRFWQIPRRGLNARPITLTLTVAVAFALLDEVHQIAIPGRQCSWLDLLADLFGIGLGSVVIWVLIRRSRLHSAGEDISV